MIACITVVLSCLADRPIRLPINQVDLVWAMAMMAGDE